MKKAVEGRRFAAFAAAVVVWVVDDRERILVLSSPRRPGIWEVVNGAMEAGESVLEAALRETREEAGAQVRVKPLGAFHVESFDYSSETQKMLSICYLVRYLGGDVQPGDDMQGSAHAWWTLAELAKQHERCVPPLDRPFLGQRAIEAFRAWRDQDVELQPGFSADPAASPR